MKRALRFGILVVVLAVGAWISGSHEAVAVGDCVVLNGKGCRAGSSQPCNYYEYPDTYSGWCTCTSPSYTWSCAY